MAELAKNRQSAKKCSLPSSNSSISPVLVAGASKGEGLGNQFLANIRETDAIVNVVRCFDDDNIVHVAEQVDPIADIETIGTELALADLASVEKKPSSAKKNAPAQATKTRKTGRTVQKLPPHLDEGKPVHSFGLDAEELAMLKPLFLLTAKPLPCTSATLPKTVLKTIRTSTAWKELAEKRKRACRRRLRRDGERNRRIGRR